MHSTVFDSSDPVTANSANEKTKGWTDTKHNEFLINLDRDKLTNVIDKLSDDTHVNKEHLNDVMLDIEHLLRDSGKVTLDTYIPGKNTQCKNNSKRWYNNECKWHVIGITDGGKRIIYVETKQIIETC